MVQAIFTAAPSTDKQIKKLVKAVRQRRAWVAMHEAKLDTLRDELRALLEASGETWQDDIGYARLVPDSVRTSYDSKAIDDLILHDPAFDCLRAYRRESKVRASIQVK